LEQYDTDEARRRFELLFERHRRAVLGYALRRVDDPADAADALAATFLVAWRRIDDVPSQQLPWLLGIARRVVGNLARGDFRREALTTRLRETAAEWTDVADEHDDPALDAALEDLREPDREALMLVYWDGLSTAEAATAMNTTAAAMRVRLYRARRQLEQRLRSRQGHVDIRRLEPSKELR